MKPLFPSDVAAPTPGEPSAVMAVDVERVESAGRQIDRDFLAVEEPLEIRVGYELGGRRVTRSVSITMRTPGEDFELATGFLFTEGIIAGVEDIDDIRYCSDEASGESSPNIVRVELGPGASFDPVRLQRNFYTTSSCGVCGKASLEALQLTGVEVMTAAHPTLPKDLVHHLPGRLRQAQQTFEKTGGLHAAGLFDSNGELLASAEDVGRHNAVDKLVGGRLLAKSGGLDQGVLVVSGRTSFEILQKALVARIPIVVAVGAPSTLAVELARFYGMTLLGFVRDGRYNVYSGFDRIVT
jgi:FdhD protein